MLITNDCDYPYWIAVYDSVVGNPAIYPKESELDDNCVCRKLHADPYQLPGL